MALFEKFYEPVQKVQKAEFPDGQGGWTSYWLAFNEFEAAIVLDTSVEARVAESQGMNRTYTITSPLGTNLGFGDIVKRVSDGRYFRVTSESSDVKTPSVASFRFEQVKAEAWELPDE